MLVAVPVETRALRRATGAVYAVFILSGFAFASWASRIPQVRDALGLSPRSLSGTQATPTAPSNGPSPGEPPIEVS